VSAWIKLAVSACVLAAVYFGFNGSAAIALVRDIRLECLLWAVALGVPIFALGAWRWQRIARVNGVGLGFATSLRVTAESHFFNQGLPSTLGGDAYRIWVLTNHRVSASDAVGCVATDRLIGVLALALLVALAQFRLVDLVADYQARLAVWFVIAVVTVAIVVVVAVGRLLARRERGPALSRLAQSIGHLKTLIDQPVDFAVVMLAGLGGHGLFAMIFFALAVGLYAPVTATQAITIFPTVFLLSMMPITIAGWGVREAILITALKLFDVPSVAAVALGVSFGICMLIISIPGALLWMIDRERGA
jgi:uncharacterized protein (TIRG00374 family)